MKKTIFAAITLVTSLLAAGAAQAGTEDAGSRGRGHYEQVNGLNMYYEVHGKGKPGERPLVLLHGAFSATGTSFGELLPVLAKHRKVISVEQQAHGHTADIDRPLRVEQMAEDTIALLRKIGIGQADFFGYSMGAGIGLQIGVSRPEIVGKLVLASVTSNPGGLHPGLLEGLDQLKPEHLHGSPFHEEYLRTAPRPEDFPRLVEQVKDMNRHMPTITDERIRAMKKPTLLLTGDSDIVRPEHSVELFRLLGGGVVGDTVGLPDSQLAILPGTTHVTLVHQVAMLAPIIPAFLDRPVA